MIYAYARGTGLRTRAGETSARPRLPRALVSGSRPKAVAPPASAPAAGSACCAPLSIPAPTLDRAWRDSQATARIGVQRGRRDGFVALPSAVAEHAARGADDNPFVISRETTRSASPSRVGTSPASKTLASASPSTGGTHGERELTRPHLCRPRRLIYAGDEACVGEFGVEDAATVTSDELWIRRHGRHHERLKDDRRFKPQPFDQRRAPSSAHHRSHPGRSLPVRWAPHLAPGTQARTGRPFRLPVRRWDEPRGIVERPCRVAPEARV